MTGTLFSRASAASSPPVVTTTRGAPSFPAASKHASVSSVLPEYDEHSTSASPTIHGTRS
jgi:hypothetical protein